MALKITNQLIHLPNEITIDKVVSHNHSYELFQCDLRENVDDTAGITIGDIAVKFVCNPALSGGIIDAGRTLEFINA